MPNISSLSVASLRPISAMWYANYIISLRLNLYPTCDHFRLNSNQIPRFRQHLRNELIWNIWCASTLYNNLSHFAFHPLCHAMTYNKVAVDHTEFSFNNHPHLCIYCAWKSSSLSRLPSFFLLLPALKPIPDWTKVHKSRASFSIFHPFHSSPSKLKRWGWETNPSSQLATSDILPTSRFANHLCVHVVNFSYLLNVWTGTNFPVLILLILNYVHNPPPPPLFSSRTI